MAKSENKKGHRRGISVILLILSICSATIPELVVLLHYFPLVRDKATLCEGTVSIIIIVLSVVLSSVLKSRLSKVLPWTICPLVFFICGAVLLSAIESIIHEMALIMIAGAAGMLGATVLDVASMLCRPEKDKEDDK